MKLRFSALHVLTGTVWLPVNLRERNEGSSKRCDFIELSTCFLRGVLSSVENLAKNFLECEKLRSQLIAKAFPISVQKLSAIIMSLKFRVSA